MEKHGVLRYNTAATNIMQNKVDNEIDLEYKHVCKKFGICRTNTGFSDFVADILKIILTSRDDQVKVASDALTEVAKETDFSEVITGVAALFFKTVIGILERSEVENLRSIYSIAMNTLAHKNRPLKVVDITDDKRTITRTLSFLELINTFDAVIPANEENKLEWSDIKNGLEQWQNDEREDILDIMQSFIGHIKSKGIDKLDAEGVRNVRESFAKILM
ncbi:uncharacterized protein LOC131845327 [Achroia grisella]|uniref:uncharacterized protein LOC131845327 n=1 Tax=Achroia grisella TaxID=688607 RepID=UPI0027D32D44|nr:uncharacterized protein LOC131845327 [Achroia grisella]